MKQNGLYSSMACGCLFLILIPLVCFTGCNPTTTNHIIINAVVEGTPWPATGQESVNYTITGPTTISGTSVPQTFIDQPTGTYHLSIANVTGGPGGATLAGIDPSPDQILTLGGTIIFNLYYKASGNTGKITVNATLDGQPWPAIGQGAVNYTIHGPTTTGGSPTTISGSSVTQFFANELTGIYTIMYNNSGGPVGAVFAGYAPSQTQTLNPNSSITFTLQFTSGQNITTTTNSTGSSTSIGITTPPSGGWYTSSINVTALLNGSPWPATGQGAVNYTLGISGQVAFSYSSVPLTVSTSAGNYILTYVSGGPPGATFAGYTPLQTQTLNLNGTITFTLNFN